MATFVKECTQVSPRYIKSEKSRLKRSYLNIKHLRLQNKDGVGRHAGRHAHDKNARVSRILTI